MAKDEPAPDRLADLSPGQDGRGALVQLLARGPQNVFLDEIPQMTFWRLQYSRHTNFAVDTVERVFPLGLRFGKTARVDLPRGGDMMGDLWVELRLPALTDPDGSPHAGAWQPRVGRVLLRRAKLVINDTTVHDHERLWYDLNDALFAPAGREAALADMLGGSAGLPTAVPHTLHVPLGFLCCRGHRRRQQFLPLLCLTGATISVELELDALAACVQPSATAPADPGDWGGASRLLCDAVFLDAAERAGLLAEPAVLMFEDVQDMEEVNYRPDDRFNGVTTNLPAVNVSLQELNHPVRALVFVAYADPVSALFQYVDALEQAVVMIGSSERFSPRPGAYFSRVQPYQAAARAGGNSAVYLYSFALDLASDQPCGSVNFASLDRPFLRAQLATDLGDLKIKVFALCHRWLRCFRGEVAHMFV